MEIKIMQKLKHPNIAKFHGAYQDNKKVLLLMEYLDGGDTYDRSRGRALPAADFNVFLRDVVGAVA